MFSRNTIGRALTANDITTNTPITSIPALTKFANAKNLIPQFVSYLTGPRLKSCSWDDLTAAVNAVIDLFGNIPLHSSENGRKLINYISQVSDYTPGDKPSKRLSYIGLAAVVKSLKHPIDKISAFRNFIGSLTIYVYRLRTQLRYWKLNIDQSVSHPLYDAEWAEAYSNQFLESTVRAVAQARDFLNLFLETFDGISIGDWLNSMLTVKLTALLNECILSDKRHHQFIQDTLVSIFNKMPISIIADSRLTVLTSQHELAAIMGAELGRMLSTKIPKDFEENTENEDLLWYYFTDVLIDINARIPRSANIVEITSLMGKFLKEFALPQLNEYPSHKTTEGLLFNLSLLINRAINEGATDSIKTLINGFLTVYFSKRQKTLGMSEIFLEMKDTVREQQLKHAFFTPDNSKNFIKYMIKQAAENSETSENIISLIRSDYMREYPETEESKAATDMENDQATDDGALLYGYISGLSLHDDKEVVEALARIEQTKDIVETYIRNTNKIESVFDESQSTLFTFFNTQRSTTGKLGFIKETKTIGRLRESLSTSTPTDTPTPSAPPQTPIAKELKDDDEGLTETYASIAQPATFYINDRNESTNDERPRENGKKTSIQCTIS
ncbi:MAG: hypothetical protein KBD83_01985 [Gammaproteobacteria bacterium]|nr:hypothetical protein [Gammaproteobacteria bacterium]